MIQDTVVIGGECSLETRIEGDCDLTSMVEGDPDVLVVEGGGQTYPHYQGDYTVTPSTTAQVLDTDGKVMDDDVTVQAVQAGSATTPATIITADPTISVSSGGLITAQVNKTQQVTPTVQEGYVEEGTPGNVGVSGSNTQQLTTQGAQTIHPASTDQSIASGKYLTGAQTFKAVTVSGLTADKVLQGNVIKIGDADDDDSIMSVTGTAQGGITPTGTKQIAISSNGTVTEDVTNYASAEITTNVPASAVDTGTKSISSNGTHDVTGYASANVQVPNSYSAGDEGKVVSNGALVSQTSDTVTTNNTYDTTLINSLTVNVQGSSGYTVDEIASMSEPSGEITINVTSLSQYALRNRPITRVHAPNLKTSNQYMLTGTSLTRIEPTDFPNSGLKIITGAFESITTLTYAKLTNPLTGSNAISYAFRGCTNLVECYLPYATTNIDRTCNRCTKLQIFDGGTGNITNSNSFQNCSALRTLILRKTDAVQTLNAWSANCLGGIYSNPTASTVYVPQALISSYQTATNWSSAYTAGVTFAKIEGSIYEL